MFKRVFAVLAVLLLSAAVVSAHPVASHFSVELDAARSGAAVTGHVINTYGQGAEHVSIAIDGLDAAGNVLATTTAYVGHMASSERIDFSAPAVRGAVSYRGRVASFECLGF